MYGRLYRRICCQKWNQLYASVKPVTRPGALDAYKDQILNIPGNEELRKDYEDSDPEDEEVEIVPKARRKVDIDHITVTSQNRHHYRARSSQKRVRIGLAFRSLSAMSSSLSVYKS